MRCTCVLAIAALTATAAADSLPSPRALPTASDRPLDKSTAYYVDAVRGDDHADGSQERPWKTVAHGVTKLSPGTTLVLRAGVYYEQVTVGLAGRSGAPITIRSAPGEFAILDGGLREFAERPETAWEPYEGGAKGEYRSTATYPSLSPASADGRDVFVVGHIASSMVPLHGYKFDVDLRTTNEYWNVENTQPGTGVYVGPGVWFNSQTKRIHARLAHTTLTTQTSGNYRGETDPRKLPLVIGIDRTPLRIVGAKHVRVQGLVMRGSAMRTVEISDSSNVELDGVTIYGGSPALFVKSTSHLRIAHSTLRGLAAPWSSRASMKYRGNSPYLFIASSRKPQSSNWDIAYNEFTDGHDGVVLDSIKTLRFHHNWLDNFNDDGLYLTFPPRDVLPDDTHIYENLFTRIYTTIAFAEDKRKRNPVGSGAYVFRNVFDLREGTYGWIAKDAATDNQPLALLASRLCGDHGTPIWDPLYFYQNTVITPGAAWRNYYGAMIGVMGSTGSKRRVFNNIFLQLDGDVGVNFQGVQPDDDLQVDANLMWSAARGRSSGDVFAKFRGSPAFAASKKRYPPGWGAGDVHADPQFVDMGRGDFRLRPGSQAVDAGIRLPATWPDTRRSVDKKMPDIGALPVGSAPRRVGPSNAPKRAAH